MKVPTANAATVGDGFLGFVPLLRIQREFRLGHLPARGLLAFRVRLAEATRFLHPPRSSPGNHEPYVVHVRNNASGSSIAMLPGSFPIVAPRQ